MVRCSIRVVAVGFLTLMLAAALPSSGSAIPLVQGAVVSLVFPAPVGNPNLAASGTVTLSLLTATSAQFDVGLANSSVDSGARIVDFGFRLTPAPTAGQSITLSDLGGSGDVDAFIHAATPANVPSFNDENFCVWTGSNCSGGGNTGLRAGQTDRFRFTLSGSFGSSIDLDVFAIKYQGCIGCSFEVLGSDPLAPAPVPEPSLMLLGGFGMTALALAGRARAACSRRSGRA